MLALRSKRLKLIKTPICRLINTGERKKAGRVVFSGIQPTGVPHIGNYLGALQNWVKLQRNAKEDDKLIYSVVGWHALTLPQNPQELLTARRDMFAVLLAIGLDPKRSIIFHQDQNPDHTELAWLLSCLTPCGKLQRMTTWKSKLAIARNANDESEVDESMLNTGLFTYPVLMAADILAYRSTHVPVGEDQQQHLELCRDLAAIFNRYTKSRNLPIPDYITTSTKRILSLRDPSTKMSKSAVDKNSRILMTDDTETIKKKIRSAVTDADRTLTYDPENRPGTSNLLTIYSGCTGEDVREIAEKYHDKGHGDFKKDLSDIVEETIKGPRSEFMRLKEDPAYLDTTAKEGLAKARYLSGGTLHLIRQLLGLEA